MGWRERKIAEMGISARVPKPNAPRGRPPGLGLSEGRAESGEGLPLETGALEHSDRTITTVTTITGVAAVTVVTVMMVVPLCCGRAKEGRRVVGPSKSADGSPATGSFRLYVKAAYTVGKSRGPRRSNPKMAPPQLEMHMASSSEKHWFNAQGLDRNGDIRHFAVSKKGRLIYIEEAGGKRHLCHPFVDDSKESVTKEISPVFRVSVSDVEM